MSSLRKDRKQNTYSLVTCNFVYYTTKVIQKAILLGLYNWIPMDGKETQSTVNFRFIFCKRRRDYEGSRGDCIFANILPNFFHDYWQRQINKRCNGKVETKYFPNICCINLKPSAKK